MSAVAAVAMSRGLRALRHLPAFLNVDVILTPREAHAFQGEVCCVLVWGRKANTTAALRYAKLHDLPVWYLEDGWIRSSAKNAHARLCYSIQVDTTGVYYDSRSECDLENTLNLPAEAFRSKVGVQQLSYASNCRAQLLEHNITKYNYCKNTPAISNKRPLVLVIDQTRDDASVRFGGMDEQHFAAMLQAAMDENPGSNIVVRTHPDVLSGRRRGYLSELADAQSVELTSGNDNPIAMLKQASRVYVGTSQLGYEALLCGIPTVVFGLPFYAGWGLTDDRQALPRRCQQRTLDELFYVTHVLQARYCNPITGEPWQLHQCLDHVVLQQRMFARNAFDFHCVGITPWKRRYITQYLRSPDGSVSFSKHHHPEKRSSRSCLLTWSFRAFAEKNTEKTHEKEQLPIFRVEDGFLRSAGLGSDFTAPASLVVDTRGLYFDPSNNSDLEHLLNHHDCSLTEIKRAIRLKKLILSSRLSKYNVGVSGCTKKTPPPSSRKIVVVGQVEDDQSIQRGCRDIRKNGDLLETVRSQYPDAWICYKPHPDVLAGNRRGHIESSVLKRCANDVDTNSSIVDCIELCDELHTMTSLSGFEALLRGKQVVTYGGPFYAGWGLTDDRQTLSRRIRRRTFDELLYIALIEYPRYMDIDSGEFMTPEDLVFTINSQRAMNNNYPKGWTQRQLNKCTNIIRGLSYAP